MKVVEFADPRAFQDRVLPFLLQRECEHCVQIGVIQRLIEGKSPLANPSGLKPNLLCVESAGGTIEMVAMQTPPAAMLLTRGSEAAIAALIEHLRHHRWRGGILGLVPSISIAVREHRRVIRDPLGLKVRLRSFQLTKVMPPRASAGFMRPVENHDLSLLTQWCNEFAVEIGETGTRSDEQARGLIEERRPVFWVDREPVSMAAWAGPTPNGIRVNFVYTPPKHRGRGYASNLVASLSQDLLDRGRKFCFLHTDQANPTSNSIYQKLGYRAMSDMERWEPLS